MSKIIVPQELQEKILNLYTEQQLNRKQIKQQLSLPFGDSVILRILKEHNIIIRTNNGALKGGRKKQEVDQELQQKIIEKYNLGWGLEKIVQELQLPFSFDKVRSILKDNNIKIRNVQESAQVKEFKDTRQYTVNDDYDFISHNGAWLLGFIAADGYLPTPKNAKNRITISLAEKDEQILSMIAKEISYSGKLFHYESNGYPSVSLSFCSKEMRKKIEEFGIGNNKTFQLKHLPKLPDEYMIDFIRGYFDGDGSLFEPVGKKINMSITSASKEFLKEINEYLHNKYKTSLSTIHETIRVHPVYDVRYYVHDSFILGDLFYENDYLALPRKKQHYLDIKRKYSIR